MDIQWNELADQINRTVLGVHINSAPIDFGALPSGHLHVDIGTFCDDAEQHRQSGWAPHLSRGAGPLPHRPVLGVCAGGAQRAEKPRASHCQWVRARQKWPPSNHPTPKSAVKSCFQNQLPESTASELRVVCNRERRSRYDVLSVTMSSPCVTLSPAPPERYQTDLEAVSWLICNSAWACF